MIGVMDWGIGGLSVYQVLRRRHPLADVVYYSDSGSPPYGTLSETALRERFLHIAEFFKAKKISQVLVACNAASSIFSGESEKFQGVEFHIIIPAGVATLTDSLQSIAVIGGQRTIESQAYQRLLKNWQCPVVFAATQALSAFVEAGNLVGAEVDDYLLKLKERLGPVDGILLACTHYPALIPAFKKHFPETALLDPAEQMVTRVQHLILDLENTQGTFHFFTSGDLQASAKAAFKAFGIRIR